MIEQSPLRRWKPFFAAFGLVDAAIEAADPALCRDEIRRARGEVVELLCGVPAGAAGTAEKLCVLLDECMAESLATLQALPASAVGRVLASSSSADLTKAVCALRCHQSERVRGLAGDVIRGWCVIVEDDISRVATELDAEEEKMAATKRKLREGYRDAEEAKRQRKIQVIQAPKVPEQRQRKMHPILRERSQARCGRPAVVRRCLVSSCNRVPVL